MSMDDDDDIEMPAAAHEALAQYDVHMDEIFLKGEDEIDSVAERKQARRERYRLLLRSPGFIFGMVVILFWVFCAFFPDLVARYDPKESLRNVDPRTGPSSEAWFGTDRIGRDVYSRTVAGSQQVLSMAPLAAVLGVAGGTMLGLVVGYFRGWVDEVIGRIIDGFLSIPVILLALLAATTLGTSRAVIVLTIAILFVPVVTRTIRAAVIAEAELDYVTSAKLRGESSWFIMMREIFPNITGTVVVELTVRIGYAIFTVATLAFLGFTPGDISTPDWGVDIKETFVNIQSDQWWMTIFPAIAIASLVIAVNLVADSLDRANKS
ncbi:MAG: ABC transporter permease [Acidimicrobiales bacterium]